MFLGLMQETLLTVGNAIYVHLITPMFIRGYSQYVIPYDSGYYL